MALLYTAGTGYRELAPLLRRTEKGDSTIRRWRGQLGELRDLAGTLAATDMQITQEDETWFVLEATFTGWPDKNDPSKFPKPDDQVVRLYSLRGSAIGKSLWDLGKVVDEINKLRDFGGLRANLVGVARFRSDLMALARGEEVVFQIADKDSAKQHNEPASLKQVRITLAGMLQIAQEAGMKASVISELFEAMATGVEGYNLDTFTLRRRSVGPNGANLLPAYISLGTAFRTETLLGKMTDMPSSVRNVIPRGYWVANAPNLDQTDATRLELIEEWVFADRVSTFIYDVQ